MKTIPEVEGEVEIECTCPKCGHKWIEIEYVTLEFDFGDYAPDYSWRD